MLEQWNNCKVTKREKGKRDKEQALKGDMIFIENDLNWKERTWVKDWKGKSVELKIGDMWKACDLKDLCDRKKGRK